MVQVLKYGEPILKVKYIEDESDFAIGGLAILVNVSYDNREDIMIENIPLAPMKGTIAGHTTIPHIDKAVLVENYEELAADPNVFDKFAEAWPVMYSIRPEERFKDLPFYHADGEFVHDGMIYIDSNCIAKPHNLGLHQTHPRAIDEYHCQLLGYGAMEKFHEQDFSTKFQVLQMAPGIVHDTIYDANGDYPWHQYQSFGPAVFMGIQITRK